MRVRVCYLSHRCCVPSTDYSTQDSACATINANPQAADLSSTYICAFAVYVHCSLGAIAREHQELFCGPDLKKAPSPSAETEILRFLAAQHLQSQTLTVGVSSIGNSGIPVRTRSVNFDLRVVDVIRRFNASRGSSVWIENHGGVSFARRRAGIGIIREKHTHKMIPPSHPFRETVRCDVCVRFGSA